MSWTGGHVYRLNFGAAELRLLGTPERLRFAQALELPLVDGMLRIDGLRISRPPDESSVIEFDAELRDVGMPALTDSLDWPAFAGTIGGRLPGLRYTDKVLTVGGALEALVFDGVVTVDQLRVEDPFGVLPVMTGEIRLDGLDLEAVTSAFSFGRIEGRLDGEVRELRLVNWSPVTFDARFFTPPGDRSRHRISQRAIENISDLGGFGTAAALSGGFLRFFDDFAYARIDIGCRLRNEVCTMRAPERAGNGYYIIKGKGLPRIDVIGHAQQVSWPALVDELDQVRKSEAPSVQ